MTLFDSTSNAQVGQPAVSGNFTIAGGTVANTPCTGPSPSMATVTPPFLWVIPVPGYAHTTLVGQNTHWVSGVSVGDVGAAGITVEGFNVTDATHALLNLQIDPTDPQFRSGPRTLTVRTATATCTEVVSAPINPIYKGPVLTDVTPASAPQGAQNLTVTLNGEFSSLLVPQQGPNKVDFGAGITLAGPFTVTSNSSATAVINIAVSAPIGPRDVLVANNSISASNTVTLPGGFSVNAPTGSGGTLPPGFKSGLGDKQHNLIPAISQVTPNSGSQGTAGVSVNLTGSSTHFVQGTTTADFGPGITLASPLTVTSATSATAVLNIDPQAAAGLHTVTVTTGAETATLKDGFTVNITLTSTVFIPPLTLKPIAIDEVKPTWAQKGAQNLTLRVWSSKAHFVQGTTTADFNGGITVTSVNALTPTYAEIKFNIDVGAVPGFRTVVLRTGAETAQLDSGFTVAPDPDSYGKGEHSPTNLGTLNGDSVFTIHGWLHNPDAADWFVFHVGPGTENLKVTLKDVAAPSDFTLYVFQPWPCQGTYAGPPCTYLNSRAFVHAVGSQGGAVTITPVHTGADTLYISVTSFQGHWDVRAVGFTLVVSGGAAGSTSSSDGGVPVAPPAPVTTTSPPPPPPPAPILTPQWSGSAKCEIDVTNGPNYIDHQVHTWTIKNVPVKKDNYPATWSISGQGFRAVGGNHTGTPPWVGPTVNRDFWTYKAEDGNSTISFVARTPGLLEVISENSRRNAAGGATGKETYTWLNGNPLCNGYPASCNQFASQQSDPDKSISFDVSEFPFPTIEGKSKTQRISGSASLPVKNPIMAWQPPDATATASCTWDFQYGIPAAP